MANDRYLTKRGGIFYFQQAIPEYVRPHVGGKKLWRHSLRTGDARQAAVNARPFIDYYRDICDRFRPIPLEKQAEVSSMMGALGFKRVDGKPWDAFNVTDAKDILESEMGKLLAGFRAKLETLVAQVGRQNAEAVMRDGEPGQEYQRQQQLILDALAGVEMVAAELRGETAAVTPEPPEDVTTLYDVCRDWARRTKAVELTVSEMHTTIRRFHEVVGEKDIRHVTTDDVWAFHEAVQKMPCHMSEKERALPLPVLLKSLDGRDYEQVSARTLKKRISNIRTLLDENKKLVPVNPADPVKVKKGKAEKRLPFDRADLAKMMAVEPFASHQTRHKLYWPTLIAMFTGARLSEIAPLTSDDVMQEDGIWCLRITDDPETGKRIKAEASRRYVPLHPELVRLGFPDWAKKQKGRLFGFQAYQGKAGHYLSKDFGRWLRGEAGITDTRKVAHSFRHLMKDALRDAGAPDTLQEAILGHEGRTVGDNYGTTYGIAARAAAMEKVRLPVNIP